MKLRQKITWIISIVTTMIIILLTGVIYWTWYNAMQKQVALDAMDQAIIIAENEIIQKNIVLENGYINISNALESIQLKTKIQYLYVINQDGIYFSHPLPSRINTLAKPDELKQSPLVSTPKHYYNQSSKATVEGYAPIFTDGIHSGVVVVGIYNGRILQTLRTHILYTIVFALIAIAVGVLIAYELAKSIKHEIYDLEPEEIAILLNQKELVLENIGAEIVEKLYAKILKTEIDVRLENKAVKLITNKDGAVTGVVVEDKSGKSYKIHSKSIVIATGGFGGSPEVFVYYNQKLKGYNTTNSPSATGDFITLVKDLNVQLVDMDYIQTHPTVSPQYGVLITEALRGNGGILVNNSGKRFADEMKNRDLLSEDILKQKEKEVYLIFNEGIRNSLAASDDYIDMDIITSGQTVADLAEKLRLDQLQLENTITDYNTYVENSSDKAFNRKSLKVGLESGPYYAIQVIPAVHYCMGGILIDDQGRVLNTDNLPVTGLFASGEATGGIHGQNRLGGNSLLDAVVFGRIAGKSAVGE